MALEFFERGILYNNRWRIQTKRELLFLRVQLNKRMSSLEIEVYT